MLLHHVVHDGRRVVSRTEIIGLRGRSTDPRILIRQMAMPVIVKVASFEGKIQGALARRIVFAMLYSART